MSQETLIQVERKARTLAGETRYKLLLLRGRLTHLKPFLLEGDAEAAREWSALVRSETILCDTLRSLHHLRSRYLTLE